MYQQPTDRDLNRFWKFVQKTETCWIWTGKNTSNDTYGGFLYNGKTVRAHRFSMMFFLQRELAPSEFVLHKCDVRLCVNPEHLYVGTQQDNMRDMLERNRRPRGFGSYGRHKYCKNGHEMTQENTRPVGGGYRTCKICSKAKAREKVLEDLQKLKDGTNP